MHMVVYSPSWASIYDTKLKVDQVIPVIPKRYTVIFFFTWLTCNLLTRNHFQTYQCDQIDDLTIQLHLSRDISSVRLNFLPFQEIEKMKTPDFFHEKLSSVNHKRHEEIAVCACSVTSDFKLVGAKFFFRKFCFNTGNIFHEERFLSPVCI